MHSKYRFVVLGTDTEVGKTCVASGLARAMLEFGANVIAVKPVETGCQLGSALGQDGVRLAQATGQPKPRAALRRFREPVAPPVAAERQGETIEFADLITELRTALEGDCVGIIEGAGGVLSPVTWEHTMLDVVREFDARVILVSGDRLGTLNHTRMALRVLRTEEIPVCAVVLSEVAPGGRLMNIPAGRSTGAPMDYSAGSNLKVLRQLAEIPPVTYLPYVESVEDAATELRPLARALLEME